MTGQKKTSPVDSVDVLCLVMSFCAMSDDDESNDDDEDEQCVCGGGSLMAGTSARDR